MYDTSDMKKFREDSNWWCMWITVLALVALVTSIISKIVFGYVTENITKGVREVCYTGILSKDIGWFDDAENASG